MSIVSHIIPTNYLRAPHKPEFKDVVVATTLDHLIASVVGDIVVLVLLKQIVGTHLICSQ